MFSPGPFVIVWSYRFNSGTVFGNKMCSADKVAWLQMKLAQIYVTDRGYLLCGFVRFNHLRQG